MTIPPVVPDELGASVTEDFTGAPDLDALLADTKPARKSVTPTQAPTQAPAYDPKMLVSQAQLLDYTVSAVAKVKPESPEFMEQIANAWAPLLQYYSTQQPSVTMLWTVALGSLGMYAAVKIQKVQEAKTNGTRAEA